MLNKFCGEFPVALPFDSFVVLSPSSLPFVPRQTAPITSDNMRVGLGAYSQPCAGWRSERGLCLLIYPLRTPNLTCESRWTAVDIRSLQSKP